MDPGLPIVAGQGVNDFLRRLEKLLSRSCRVKVPCPDGAALRSTPKVFWSFQKAPNSRCESGNVLNSDQLAQPPVA